MKVTIAYVVLAAATADAARRREQKIDFERVVEVESFENADAAPRQTEFGRNVGERVEQDDSNRNLAWVWMGGNNGVWTYMPTYAPTPAVSSDPPVVATSPPTPSPVVAATTTTDATTTAAATTTEAATTTDATTTTIVTTTEAPKTTTEAPVTTTAAPLLETEYNSTATTVVAGAKSADDNAAVSNNVAILGTISSLGLALWAC